MSKKPFRIAVLFHRFGPYHVARLQAAARACELMAIELAADTKEYDWAKVEAAGFERKTLFPEGDSRDADWRDRAQRISDALQDFRPDAVAIPGWSDSGAIAALGWCLRSGVRAVLMSESGADDERRSWGKELVKRRLVRCFNSALVGGQRHIEYLVQLGMNPRNIFMGYDGVDNDYFAGLAKEIRSHQDVPLGRKNEGGFSKMELPESYFLASARFIEKKNLPTLLQSYSVYRSQAGPQAWKLVLLGDGPLRSRLEGICAEQRISTDVSMPGFKQYEELPAYYANAGAFVHASTTEQWGLVVNEAAASGLPLIVSNRCGCVPELVQRGVNGFTFDPADTAELAACLSEVAAMTRDQRADLGQNSQRLVDALSPRRFADGLVDAVDVATASAPKALSLIDRCLLGQLAKR